MITMSVKAGQAGKLSDPITKSPALLYGPADSTSARSTCGLDRCNPKHRAIAWKTRIPESLKSDTWTELAPATE
jgi:hypothetical protein